MKHKYYLIGLFAFSNVALAQAQNESEILEEMIIQENRLVIPFNQSTRNIQIITKEEIQKLPVSSLNEVLAYVSGVDIRQRGPFGSQADIAIDGGSFEQTMVLWNGVKMGDAQTAHHSMNLPIPLAAIERIEILKGPAARIYGINALTGAINIVTKAQIDDFVHVNAFLGSSFKEKEMGDGTGLYGGGGVQATAGINARKTGHLLSIARENYNGQRYNTAANSIKTMYQGNANFNEKNTMSWFGGFVDNNFGANGYYAAPHDKEAHEIVKTLMFSVGTKHKVTDRITIKPRVSNRYNEDDYRFYRNDLSKARSLHYANAFMVELNGVYTTEIGDFGLGYEMRLEEINSSNLGSHKRKNQGWFAEYKNLFFNKLLINTGAYWNYNTDYGFQWYPGVDVAYLWNANLKFQGSVGSSQRIPSFTDLYVNQRPGNIGNPYLKPESAWQYEIGIDYSKKNFKFSASAFQRVIDDFIDWNRISTDIPYQPQNLGQQNMRGIQVGIKQDIEVSSNQKFGYSVSYQYLSPKDEGNTIGIISKYKIESLKHQVISGIHYRINNFSTQLQSRYVKREMNEGYFITDLRLQYQFSSFQIYMQATNLFNSTYKEVAAVPMPPRWLQLGFQYHLNFKNKN